MTKIKDDNGKRDGNEDENDLHNHDCVAQRHVILAAVPEHVDLRPVVLERIVEIERHYGRVDDRGLETAALEVGAWKTVEAIVRVVFHVLH